MRQQHYSTLYSDDQDVREPGIYGAFGAPAAKSLVELDYHNALFDNESNMPSEMFIGSSSSKKLHTIPNRITDIQRPANKTDLPSDLTRHEKDSD